MRYETQCHKIKLKSGSLEHARKRATTLYETRRDEALATLRDETVIIESVFLDSTNEGDYLIIFMKAESFEKSRSAVEDHRGRKAYQGRGYGMDAQHRGRAAG